MAFLECYGLPGVTAVYVCVGRGFNTGCPGAVQRHVFCMICSLVQATPPPLPPTTGTSQAVGHTFYFHPQCTHPPIPSGNDTHSHGRTLSWEISI